MISVPLVKKQSIRFHYNLITPFYRLLWGRHIHHGLWSGDESVETAQQQLIDSLAEMAVERGNRVLDVGCGMGGSSIHLALEYACHVRGLTLSPVQRRWAASEAWWRNAGAATDFQCIDAEAADFPDGSFDVVWSIECTEHLFDKPAFFRRAARWLKPGGRLAVCAWLAGPDQTPEKTAEVEAVCRGFLCPSLGTMADYQQWFAEAGLTMKVCHDWTDRVARTWEICADRLRRSKLRKVANLFGREAADFLDHFEIILQAYRSGAMQYGAIVFERPPNS